jgi:hypothetical protein
LASRKAGKIEGKDNDGMWEIPCVSNGYMVIFQPFTDAFPKDLGLSINIRIKEDE